MVNFHKYSIQYKAFNSRGETVGNGFREEIAHSEERAVQVLKETVRSWTRNADRIETKTLSCEPVGKESEPAPLTPDNCGASQLACNIINNTFLSLDGFEAMRKQMAGTEYKAEHFGAELARIVDREIADLINAVANAIPVMEYAEVDSAAEGLDKAHSIILNALDAARAAVAVASVPKSPKGWASVEA